MNDWRLVPYEPTPEMVEAALEGHMPFGDMDLAIRLAILAAPPYEELASGRQAGAPDVQSDPVGEIRFDLGVPSVAYAELYSETLPSLAPGTKLYAAPPPAPDVAALVKALEEIENWTLRYTSSGKGHPIASTARKAIDAYRKHRGDV